MFAAEVLQETARGGWRRGADALPFLAKSERLSGRIIGVESITRQPRQSSLGIRAGVVVGGVPDR